MREYHYIYISVCVCVCVCVCPSCINSVGVGWLCNNGGKKILYYYMTFVLRYTWKEGNVLFNDALNTFILRLYSVGHIMVKATQIAREEIRYPHFHRSTLFAFVIPVAEHWMER